MKKRRYSCLGCDALILLIVENPYVNFVAW